VKAETFRPPVVIQYNCLGKFIQWSAWRRLDATLSLFFPSNYGVITLAKIPRENKEMATLLHSIQDKYGADDADREEYGWIVFVSNSPECKKGMFPPIMTLSDYDISSIGNYKLHICVYRCTYVLVLITGASNLCVGAEGCNCTYIIFQLQSLCAPPDYQNFGCP
jgi:hypothetical protein